MAPFVFSSCDGNGSKIMLWHCVQPVLYRSLSYHCHNDKSLLSNQRADSPL